MHAERHHSTNHNTGLGRPPELQLQLDEHRLDEHHIRLSASTSRRRCHVGPKVSRSGCESNPRHSPKSRSRRDARIPHSPGGKTHRWPVASLFIVFSCTLLVGILIAAAPSSTLQLQVATLRGRDLTDVCELYMSKSGTEQTTVSEYLQKSH